MPNLRRLVADILKAPFLTAQPSSVLENETVYTPSGEHGLWAYRAYTASGVTLLTQVRWHNYCLSPGTAASWQIPTQNYIYCLPLIISSYCKAVDFMSRTAACASGAMMHFGLYDIDPTDPRRAPRNLVFCASGVSVANNDTYCASLPSASAVTLAPGLYWMAYNCTQQVQSYYWSGGNPVYILGAGSVNPWIAYGTSNSYMSGLPSVFPATPNKIAVHELNPVAFWVRLDPV